MSPTSDRPRWAISTFGLVLVVLVLRVMGQVTMISLDLFHEMALLLVLVAAVFAFRSVRILPFDPVTFVCYVPAALGATPAAELLRKGGRRDARPIWARALVPTAAGAWNVGQSNPLTVELPTEPGSHLRAYRAGVVDYVAEARFPGKLMTRFGVGAFLSWYLYPDVKVGLDSRYEVVYPRRFVEEAEAGPPWIETYRDDACAIFARPEVAARLSPIDRRGRSIEARFP